MSLASFSNAGFAPEALNASIINMWTRDEIHPAQFYRTGFETIFFNHNRQYALNCLLSSAVPSDREIVIVGQENLSEVISGANQFDIPNLVFEGSPDEISLVDAVLGSETNVSHFVLVIGKDDEQIEKYINHLKPILKFKGIDLILYCTSSVQSINDRTNGAVDYMIGGWSDFPDNSFVVARRNKLVQTEGNSRALNFDLYASWQWCLQGRGSNIAPMEM
ncbi:2-aminoethylphosphonate--pyruvate aminotransferase [Marinilabilia rubra]|uniref:2-aminoethylphosphonate--pyruvate aminotransferase n=1 Tax=Marinilabilia rubra TaxID=2162893 RepID=A0A2U2BDA3_9BACT|nr:2-aminoethylphosphonate--pyruvate aminotransferase [Marinilabilia rubra]PWE01056.1 2-aminoethylphosphonate--pyruvate aminotransferase [Marinilabilia rubra]